MQELANKMIDYLFQHYDRLLNALLEHMQIVGLALFYSIILASIITLLVMRSRIFSQFVVIVLGAAYSIPSLALFAILIPFLGIGMNNAIIVLILYNQFLLVRNFLAGFEMIDQAILEAAIGMGMPPATILLKIKLPLAFPAIMVGIHLAVISTIGIATIAATVNAGGIGVILFDGLRTVNTVKILWGTILSAGLAIIANLLLNGFQYLVNKNFKPNK
jgi:osmoprotectant transport system permease protein